MFTFSYNLNHEAAQNRPKLKPRTFTSKPSKTIYNFLKTQLKPAKKYSQEHYESRTTFYPQDLNKLQFLRKLEQ